MARRVNKEAKKGIYLLNNPHKYIGTLTKDGTQEGVLFRSSWEERMYYYMDHNKNIVEWSAESVIIPFLFTLDGKVHRYYPDIYCKVNTRDGIKKYIFEVKPEWQTVEPQKPKNRSLERKKRFEKEMYTFVKNRDKWNAAEEWCKKNDHEFMVLTEKHIFAK